MDRKIMTVLAKAGKEACFTCGKKLRIGDPVVSTNTGRRTRVRHYECYEGLFV